MWALPTLPETPVGEARIGLQIGCVAAPPEPHWKHLHAETFAKCRKEAQHTRDALMEGKWVTIALIAFAPAIAWLLVYGLLGLKGDQGTA